MDTKTIEHTAQTVSYVGASTTGLAAVWAWLGTNHNEITATCAIVGMIVALIGAAINGYERFIKPRLDDTEE